MQCLIVISVVAVVVSAEPPRFNSRLTDQFERAQNAPYEPSGWRPSGPQFRLPSRQQAPPDQYGPPPPEYLPPENSTGAPDLTTTIDSKNYDYLDQLQEEPKKRNGTKNGDEREKENEKLTQVNDKEEGAYYIYHPTGLLQRVTYVTRNDEPNMQFTAQLMYKNVEPMKGPIYTYDPETFVFTKVQP